MPAIILDGSQDSMRPKDTDTDPSTQKDDVLYDDEPVKDDVCAVNLSATQEKRVWRRIDLRLIPIITVMYLFSFMDRGMYIQQIGLRVFVLY